MAFVLFWSILLGLLFPPKILATAENSGFSLSPPFQEVVLDKEQKEAVFFLKISNLSPTHQTLKLSVIDFASLDESGGVAFLGGKSDSLENKYSLASWLILEKNILELAPQTTQSLKITVANKESLSPGGHYGAVLATVAGESEEKRTVSLNQAFSSLILVKKTGGEITQLELKNLEILASWWQLPKKIRLRFQNLGNIHLIPRGIITVSDPRGTIVSKGILNQESAYILPETFRLFPVALQELRRPFLPGRYQLTVQYRFEGKDDFQSRQESFLLIPPLSLAGAILLAGVIWRWRKKLKKK